MISIGVVALTLEHQQAKRILGALRDCAARSECPVELSRDFVSTLHDSLPQATRISIEWVQDDPGHREGDGSTTSIRHETSMNESPRVREAITAYAIPKRLKKHALLENEDVYAPHAVDEREGQGSHHISPIRKGPRVVGLLCLTSNRPRAFTADERCVLRAVADCFGGLLRDHSQIDASKPERESVPREAE